MAARSGCPAARPEISDTAGRPSGSLRRVADPHARRFGVPVLHECQIAAAAGDLERPARCHAGRQHRSRRTADLLADARAQAVLVAGGADPSGDHRRCAGSVARNLPDGLSQPDPAGALAFAEPAARPPPVRDGLSDCGHRVPRARRSAQALAQWRWRGDGRHGSGGAGAGAGRGLCLQGSQRLVRNLLPARPHPARLRAGADPERAQHALRILRVVSGQLFRFQSKGGAVRRHSRRRREPLEPASVLHRHDARRDLELFQPARFHLSLYAISGGLSRQPARLQRPLLCRRRLRAAGARARRRPVRRDRRGGILFLRSPADDEGRRRAARRARCGAD